MVFIELPIFTKVAADLFSDDDMAKIQNILLSNNAVGDVIPGGRGLRKMRIPLKGRGQRGGARVIYYNWINKEQCYLVYAYAKNTTTNLTQHQLQQLAIAMQLEVLDG